MNFSNISDNYNKLNFTTNYTHFPITNTHLKKKKTHILQIQTPPSRQSQYGYIWGKIIGGPKGPTL